MQIDINSCKCLFNAVNVGKMNARFFLFNSSFKIIMYKRYQVSEKNV